MTPGSHCAMFSCSNEWKYHEKQVVFPHVGILQLYTPKSEKDVCKWERLLSRCNRSDKISLSVRKCVWTNLKQDVVRRSSLIQLYIWRGLVPIEKAKRMSFPRWERQVLISLWSQTNDDAKRQSSSILRIWPTIITR